MRRIFLIALVASLVLPTMSHAQVSWDGPSLVGTASPGGLSLFAVDPSPGSGLGMMAQWRQGSTGYRVGLTRDAADDLAVFGGIDISGSLATGVEEAEVDVRWWSGVGAGVGSEVVVSVPLGIVVGWEGSGDGVVFAPYAGGHAVLDVATGEGDTIDLSASFDVGLDLTLVSGWMVRFGASIGGRDALALGVRVPSGGRPHD